ncbi:tetratricopeptide repeat protein [Methanobacterium oryzae]|uniref:tetratricopeptide repeat protein n=1 Tax=Methanobacterium oryzae TaxID=69540 RepID=UPI003D1E5109
MLIIKSINSFDIIAVLGIIILAALSIIFNQFLLFFVFMVLAWIVAVTFMYFYKTNQKLYLCIVVPLFFLASAFFYLIDLRYQLVNSATLIFPILGGLLIGVVFTDDMERLELLKESASLMEMSKFNESLFILDKSLESRTDYRVMYLKASILGVFGRYEETLELVNQLEKKSKALKIHTLNLKSVVLLGLKRFEEAEVLIKNILKKNSNEHALVYKGILLSKMGRKQESIKYYEDALELMDKNLLKFRKSKIKRIRLPESLWKIEITELLNQKGYLFYMLGQYDSALEYFNESLKINPNGYLSWANKAYALAKLGQYDEALDSVNKSLELFSGSAYTWGCKGYILCNLKKPEEALEYYDKAIGIDPLDEEIYYRKGKAHQELEQYEDALSCYNRVLKLNTYCERAKIAKKEVKRTRKIL